MLNRTVRILAVLFVFLIQSITAHAQTTPLARKTDSVARLAIRYLNAGEPDSAYQLVGEAFRKQVSATLFRSIFKDQLSKFLPINGITFTGDNGSVNTYKLAAATPLIYKASLDNAGKLLVFAFVPSPAEVGITDPTARKIDTFARKILGLMDRRQADSVYMYAGQFFRSQLSAEKWRNVATNALFPLTPLPPAVFVSSKGGVNKYKIGPYQFLFGLIDDKGKFNNLILQAYSEDGVKSKKAATDNPLQTPLDKAADKVLSAYIQRQGNVGLSAGIFYKGAAIYYNYGETKKDGGQLPTAHTFYDIGSITKTFTATLLALAVTEKKITLQTPIVRFLPDSVASNPDLKHITFQELSNHTSGFPRLPDNFQGTVTDQKQPYANYGISDMFSYLEHYKATRAPGIKYEYSNFGAGLLGKLLEKVFKKPYPELIKQYITGAANLNETVFAVNSGAIAEGYDEGGSAVPMWNLNALQAAGAIKSTASDLLAYGKLQTFPPNGPLGAAIKLTHQVTFKDSVETVGLGWHFLPNMPTVLQHSGGTGGYRTMICIDPEKQIVVVVLTNNASTGDSAGAELMDAAERL